MPSTFIDPKALLVAGVHFGHKVSRWNPKMAPYIFARRNLIHIIDVRETVKGLIKACHFLEKLAAKGELILFVGTKRQACTVVRNESKRCGMPYVAERWLGGTLTNYATIRERLGRLKTIETWEEDGTINRYGKKEQASIAREKRKLIRNLDGIRMLDRLPAALVLIDPMHESIAVAEADKVGAATVALIDSDGNPDAIDVPIPGNDDSMKVIQIVVAKLADAVLEGRARAPHVATPEPVPQQAISVGGRERGGRGRGERLFGFGGPRGGGGGGGGGGGRGRGPGGPRPAPAAPAAPPQG
ncbi:MAG TPA: 30S ribosomal protein S2 [Planctomycetota bacterium]|nr:30S ribosomal protein S2 [Planctomycetota bacterium]